MAISMRKILFEWLNLLNIPGHVRVLYLGLVGNVIRFMYISYIRHAWAVLPIEFLQGNGVYSFFKDGICLLNKDMEI